MKKIYLLLLLLNFSLEIFAGNLACPTVAISYSGSPFCFSSTTQMVTMTGTDNFTGGTFSSTSGLWINASTGTINPSQSTPGSYTVTYTIPSGPGCPVVSATAAVVILPVPVATMNTSTPFVCYGNSATVTFSGTPNTTVTYTVNSGPTQNVSLGASGIATLMTPPLTVNTTYSLVGTSTSGGCTNMLSGATTIIVNQTPTVTANVYNTTICSGETLNISLNSSIPGTTYYWTVNAAGVMGATAGNNNTTGIINQTLHTINAGPYNGQVVYTITPYLNGCLGNPMTITVNVYPIPNSIVLDGSICIDSNNNTLSSYLLETGINAGDYSFNWYLDGNPIPATGSTLLVDDISEIGMYTVTVTNLITGCTSTDVASVTTNTAANSLTTTEVLDGNGNYTITVNVNGSGSYLYQIDGGTYQSSNVFYDVLPGQHDFHVTDTNGCTSLSYQFLGTNEFNTTTFTLGPNPAKDILTIKGTKSFSQITILNQLGQQVVQKELNVNEVQLDLSHLKSGIYFVTINSENKQTTHKIIKQ